MSTDDSRHRKSCLTCLVKFRKRNLKKKKQDLEKKKK